MTNRALIATAASAALLIAITGCSSTAVLESTPPAAVPPAVASDDEPGGEGAAPGDEGAESGGEVGAAGVGAYLDYYDGAIADTPGLKVLFFHAQWCPKCRALDADIEANAIPAGMTIFKVDFDTAIELRQTYGVTLQTTIVYVDDEGDVLAKGVLYDDTTLDALLAAAP